MIGWLRDVHDELVRRLRDFDPSLVRSEAAAEVFERAAQLEKAFGGLALLAQARATESGAWRADGAASAEQWVAAKTGRTRAEAADTIATSRRLSETPMVADALRRGELSTAQASTVARAAVANPAAEQQLVRAAATVSVEQLRTQARAAEASARADHEAAQQRRAHERRYFTTRTDDDGAVVGSFRLTALAGARLAACMAPFHEAAFERVRATGGRERVSAIAADAFVAMAEASTGQLASAGSERQRRATIVARVDLTALERGRTVAGETCSIDGIGPVPVETVASLVADAAVVALLADGDRIVDVRLAGRAMPARLRHAVYARDRHCVVPGCGRDRHLEIHHLDRVADGGATFLDGLALVCSWHYDEVTHHGAVLWREPVPPGAPGGWHYEASPPTEPAGGPFDDGFTDIHCGSPPLRVA